MSTPIPEITESTKFNFITSIWIVPFIALIIAGWLGYQYFADRGPEIKIIFPENQGLTAGQSVLKFKNVPIGKVTAIYIPEDLSGVEVFVRLNSQRSKPFLTENARFWIVKPEVGITGVSGLDTLLSGTYINIYSKPGGKEFKDKFIGLNQPYRDTTEGHYFHLVTLHSENVSVGMPVYYKNIKVGQVEYVYLGLDNKSVDTIIFVDKQYVSLVHDDSKFWIKSSFNVDFSKGSLDVNIAPLNFLVQGGIVFSSSGHEENATVDTDRIFALYDSKTKAESKSIGSAHKKIKAFELVTDQSTANLREGSPVRYAGFDIGWIDNINVNYNSTSHKMSANIIMNIDTSVFENNREDNITGEDNLYAAVQDGLRARLDTLDMISGMLYIDLTFDHHEGNSTILEGEHFARFPMVEDASIGMMGSMTRLMDKLSKLPLDKLINSLDKVINEASEPIANANDMLKDLKKSAKDISRLTGKKSFETMPDEIDNALKELTKTLKSTKKVVNGYGQNSMLTKQLAYTLEILTKTSKEMQVFLRMLNRKPNSLIFGD